MGIVDAAKKAVKRVKKAIKAFEAPARSQELLDWQKKLDVAKAGQDLTLMDKREYRMGCFFSSISSSSLCSFR